MNDERLRQLFDLYCEDRLDETQRQNLNAHLRESEKARQAFWAHVYMHSALRSLAQGKSHPATGAEMPQHPMGKPIAEDTAFVRPDRHAHARFGARDAARQRAPSSRRYRRFRPPFRTASNLWLAAGLAAAVALAVTAFVFHQDRQSVLRPASAPLGELIQVVQLEKAALPALIVRSGGQQEEARTGLALSPGDRIETRGAKVGFRYRNEATRLEVAPEGAFTLREEDGAKRVQLDRGRLEADVARQPAGKPLVLRTPHAEVTVVGTQFALDAQPASTRLEVSEGRVQFRRLGDASGIEVRSGTYAVAAAEGPFKALPLRSPALSQTEDRNDGRHPRVLENFDATQTWSVSDFGAQLDVTADAMHAHRGARGLRIQYTPKPDDPKRYGCLEHPIKLQPGDTAIRFSLRVTEAERRSYFFLHLCDLDGDHWVLHELHLQALQGDWMTVTVEVPPASRPPERTERGDGRYDPLSDAILFLGLGYGKSTILVDEFEILNGLVPASAGRP